MAKEIGAVVKLQIKGGAANPAPPIGPALGAKGVNIMEFCKQFNAQTASKKGEVVPVIITVYTDKSFTFIIKTPPATALIKKAMKIESGSAKPGTVEVGVISWKDIEEIAKIKLPDLNAVGIEQAKKIVAGSARSMGVRVID